MKLICGSFRVLRSEKGFSLIEILLSTVVMSVLSFSAIEALQFFQKAADDVEKKSLIDQTVTAVVSSGQATIAFQQRDWASVMGQPSEYAVGVTTFANSRMGLVSDFEGSMEKLPIAFSDSETAPDGQCDGPCSGKYGFWTQQSPWLGLAITDMRIGIKHENGNNSITQLKFLTIP